MTSEYLQVAKTNLDFVQAKRAGLGGGPNCNKLMEEAQLAVQIAQVEATERLTETLRGMTVDNIDIEPPLPFEDRGEKCVHGVIIGSICGDCTVALGDEDAEVAVKIPQSIPNETDHVFNAAFDPDCGYSLNCRVCIRLEDFHDSHV